jgi:hypothetical protein
METSENLDNLVINILSKEQYDGIEEKSSSELYIVKDDATDTDNAIASRTYADVGRNAVIISTEAPSLETSRLWINPQEATEDDRVFVSPADTDLKNITDVAKNTIESATIPNFEAGTTITTTQGNTWVAPSNGYLFGYAGYESSLTLRYKNSQGVRIMGIETATNYGLSNNVMIGKDQAIYVDERKGTVELSFFPLKGVINE